MSLLRIASFNIQAGIGSRRPHHLVTHGWRYALPHREADAVLKTVARTIAPFDVVAIQEADGGGARARYRNQLAWLARAAGFPYAVSMVTRRIGRVATLGLGLLSRRPLLRVERHRLPASRHGRGAIVAEIDWGGEPLIVIATHLSLRRRARRAQMAYLAALVRDRRTVLLGDLNCEPHAPEFRWLITHSPLTAPRAAPSTWPSWRPRRAIDHLLATDDLRWVAVDALPASCSDHLPLAGMLRAT